MQQLADELLRGIRVRSKALERQITEYQGRLGDTKLPIGRALELIAEFPDGIEKEADALWDELGDDPETQVPILRNLLVQQTKVMALFDQWLSHDAQTETPLFLLSAIKEACQEMGLGHREPILAMGRANNFFTLLDDLNATLFGKFDHYRPDGPASETKFALIRVPNLEGRGVLWAPLILGHELAHLAIAKKEEEIRAGENNEYASIDAIVNRLRSDLKGDRLLRSDLNANDLNALAENWVKELLCDAYLVRAYGLPGVAASSDYLQAIGATYRFGLTHPSGRLRLEFMLEWLDNSAGSLESILAPCRQLLEEPIKEEENPVDKFWQHVQERINDILRVYCQTIGDEVKQWKGKKYEAAKRLEHVKAIGKDLEAGIPCDDTYMVEGSKEKIEIDVTDVVLAAWQARVDPRYHSPGEDDEDLTDIPYSDLLGKGLEDAHFVARFRTALNTIEKKEESDQARSEEQRSDDENVDIDDMKGSVLSAAELSRRLKSQSEDRVVVRPNYLQKLDGASIDLRLGNKFIVFIRSRITSFDPGDSRREPRSIQRLIQLDWSSKFTLHPNELVLAATLEYIVIPPDLTAQVITRSSYGRLGLLSATAIQVQPGFHGCLTLELANLSSVPLELRPGARIAQLVLSKVSHSAGSKSRYSYSVAPQFSLVQRDNETEALTIM